MADAAKEVADCILNFARASIAPAYLLSYFKYLYM